MIGVVALGAEAGTWYVTKQKAQTAADGAAYSGALKLACSLAASSCTDGQSVDYRGKQVASQNAFCNAGDSSYPGNKCPGSLPSGTSRTVQIASLTSWNGAAGNYVQATVSQQQPAYLAKVLGLSAVNIAATAVASVVGLAKPPCALSLSGSISFQGSPNINALNCGMATNSRANNALDFTGGGMTVNLGSLSASGGCTGATKFCSAANTFMPPVANPFSPLDAVTLPTLPNCSGSTLTAYSAATPCKNNNYSLSGMTDVTLPGGVYFISGTFTLKGNASILGTALFILLPNASFSMKGSGLINIKGNSSIAASQLPTVLQPQADLLANMSLYYQSSTAVTIGGSSQVTFNGTMYAPNAAVTFQGNPVVNGCGELIAASVAFNGNATFDSSGCDAIGAPKLTSAQYVKLVP
jgi:hypothetical protein